jgi:hypothetical protein
MRIITKYYDEEGKLRVLKDKDKNKISHSTIRFKRLKSGKEFPCCDYQGKCTNLAYAEVYLFLMKDNKKKGWSYLCRKHYLEEQKRLKGKLPSCLKVEW